MKARIPKPRITQTMKDVMLPKKSSNRASDVTLLSAKFDVVQIKLTQLIEALKLHYKALIQVNKSRLLVRMRFQFISFIHVGCHLIYVVRL